MARANLGIDEALVERFRTACDRHVRTLMAQIEGETVVPREELAATASLEADFEELRKRMAGESAAYALFNASKEEGDTHWTLVIFVTDDAAVRDKMLYASTAEDIKRALGSTLVASEVHASALDELELGATTRHRRGSLSLLSESERLLLEEAKMERDSHHEGRGVIPFKVAPDAAGALKEFAAAEAHWVAIMVADDESLQLADRRALEAGADAGALVDPSQPRFYAYLHAGEAVPVSYFVFSCPEGVPVRQRMLYSTCKASLMDQARQLGAAFDSTVEIRSAEELQAYLSTSAEDDAASKLGATPMSGTPPAAPGGTLDHPLEFTKPSRPGRGRRKLRKK